MPQSIRPGGSAARSQDCVKELGQRAQGRGMGSFWRQKLQQINQA